MRQKAEKLLPVLLIAAALFCSLFLYARLGKYNLDADLSSEMVLAKTLNEEHDLISRNWYYSTELRVVSPVPVYQLALLLFPSWHSARLFSIAVLMILSVLSFLYACRKAGAGEAALYCAACLVLPLSWSSMFLFAWGGFYTGYFILGCLILAQVLSLEGKRKIWHALLLCALSLWAGLAGVRMLMILGVPLVLCFGILFLTEAGKGERMGKKPETRWLLASFLSLAFMLAGYIINVRMLSRYFDFRQYDRIMTDTFSLTELGRRFDALLLYFGYRDGLVLTTLGGAVSYALIFLVPALFICAFVLLSRRLQLQGKVRALPLFGLCAVFFVVILDCMAEGYVAAPTSVGYYIMGLFFVILCPFLLLSHLTTVPMWVRRAGMTLLVLFFMADSLVYVRTSVKGGEDARAKAARWLVNEGYTKGYATFWNGNILTELSDGTLEMTTYERWQGREPQEWLQKRSHLTEVSAGPVFVYTDDEEMGLDPSPCAREENLIYSQDGVRIYGYESAETVRELQRTQVRPGQLEAIASPQE